MNLVKKYYPEFTKEFGDEGYEASLNLLVGSLGEGWSVVGVQKGDVNTDTQCDAKYVLKYDGILAAGANTTAMFLTVTIPTGVESADASISAIKVVAEAIQADGLKDWEDAFAKYDAR